MNDPMLQLPGLSPVWGKSVVVKFDGGLLSQRQGQDPALGALRGPQDGEGPSVWRRHRQDARRARSAALGLPQLQKRPLLPQLRADRRGCPLRPIDCRQAIKALEDAGILSWVQRVKRCAKRVLTY